MTSGSAPPTTNTDGQPYAGIRAAAASPASMPPQVMPMPIIPAAVASLPRRARSLANAKALGSTPPSPKPMRKRSKTNCHSTVQAAAARASNP
jgi:hypothetical protein